MQSFIVGDLKSIPGLAGAYEFLNIIGDVGCSVGVEDSWGCAKLKTQ